MTDLEKRKIDELKRLKTQKAASKPEEDESKEEEKVDQSKKAPALPPVMQRKG